ncbi:Ig domain-containing protein [Methanobrevibacter smithii]|uniref:Ig domain-containing protein n=1 Tax=Methanobrevibacter smithii TaxID=2173 RepID=UPI0037DC4204
MNFTGVNLDLQGLMKRVYANLLYQSQFYKMLSRSDMEVTRTGTPIIEVIKQLDTTLNVRDNVEIANEGLKTELAKYQSVKVDLTELAMDYSFRISPIVMGSGIERAIEGQIELKNAQVAKNIDIYGFNKLNSDITGPADGSMAYTDGQITKWAPSNGTETIELINDLKSKLFDRDIYDGYLLGLRSDAYSYFISSLTSVLKYETRAGVEGVDMGQVADAYGVSVFQINSNVVAKDKNKQDTNVVGYFANEVGVVGDTFWSSFAQYNGNYPGFPGYFVLEGNILFGAKTVRPEAVIKLVESIPTVTAGSFDAGKVGESYTQATAFSGTEVVKYEAGGLPAGLSLNATSGAVTGTPTEAGSFNVSIYGVDKYGNYSNAFNGTIEIAEA